MTNRTTGIGEMSSSNRVSSPAIDRATLDSLYDRYNRREYVHPDPLEFLYDPAYADPLDREIVGLVASSLAYGAVRQILKSVAKVLERMELPGEFVRGSSGETLHEALADFKHRFTTGAELASMLYGAGRVIKRHGSLEKCFLAGMSNGERNVIPGLCHLVEEISSEAGREFPFLLPHPSRGSACKRLNLFLRWMVREDEVDPGGWHGVSPSMLIVPLDVHMYRICRTLRLAQGKHAGLRTAVEITKSFANVAPEDPVKYDFALTRLGIRDELDPDNFINEMSRVMQVKNSRHPSSMRFQRMGSSSHEHHARGHRSKEQDADFV